MTKAEYAALPAWVRGLLEATKQLGFPVVFSLGMGYVLFTLGGEMLASHKEYLQQTVAIFREQSESMDEIADSQKEMTALLKKIEHGKDGMP